MSSVVMWQLFTEFQLAVVQLIKQHIQSVIKMTIFYMQARKYEIGNYCKFHAIITMPYIM